MVSINSRLLARPNAETVFWPCPAEVRTKAVCWTRDVKHVPTRIGSHAAATSGTVQQVISRLAYEAIYFEQQILRVPYRLEKFMSEVSLVETLRTVMWKISSSREPNVT